MRLPKATMSKDGTPRITLTLPPLRKDAQDLASLLGAHLGYDGAEEEVLDEDEFLEELDESITTASDFMNAIRGRIITHGDSAWDVSDRVVELCMPTVLKFFPSLRS